MAKVQLRLNPRPDRVTFSHGGKNQRARGWLPTTGLFTMIFTQLSRGYGRGATEGHTGEGITLFKAFPKL